MLQRALTNDNHAASMLAGQILGEMEVDSYRMVPWAKARLLTTNKAHQVTALTCLASYAKNRSDGFGARGTLLQYRSDPDPVLRGIATNGLEVIRVRFPNTWRVLTQLPE